MAALMILLGGAVVCRAADPAVSAPLPFEPADRSMPDESQASTEHYLQSLRDSIENATRWAADRTNDEALWFDVRKTVGDLLYAEWRGGRLRGAKPEQAYFVRCDAMTMTQADIDNGILNIVVGAAVRGPAEFSALTVRQKTLSAKKR